MESNENIIHLDAKTSFFVLIMVAIDTVFIKFSEQEKPAAMTRKNINND